MTYLQKLWCALTDHQPAMLSIEAYRLSVVCPCGWQSKGISA